jgi:hypothetical protein
MMKAMQQQAATAVTETSKESDTAGDADATAATKTTIENKDSVKVEAASDEPATVATTAAAEVATAAVSNDATEALKVGKKKVKNVPGKIEESSVMGEEI